MGRILILNVLAGLLGGTLAWYRGRNAVVWFALCFLLPLAVIAVAFLPPVVASGRTKSCPRCAAVIPLDALHCARCGHDLPIEMKQCPKCGRVVREGEYCGECGARLGR